MSEPVNHKDTVATLLDGLDVKSRDDGSVHTIKGGNGKVVAEVCVGARKVRLNLKAAPPKGKVPKSIDLSGHSKSWEGGGLNVEPKNAKAARALLAAVVAAAPAPKQTEPSAAQLAAEQGKRTAARKQTADRVRSTGRRTGRKTATAA